LERPRGKTETILMEKYVSSQIGIRFDNALWLRDSCVLETEESTSNARPDTELAATSGATLRSATSSKATIVSNVMREVDPI
jgi:hypothetical protein